MAAKLLLMIPSCSMLCAATSKRKVWFSGHITQTLHLGMCPEYHAFFFSIMSSASSDQKKGWNESNCPLSRLEDIAFFGRGAKTWGGCSCPSRPCDASPAYIVLGSLDFIKHDLRRSYTSAKAHSLHALCVWSIVIPNEPFIKIFYCHSESNSSRSYKDIRMLPHRTPYVYMQLYDACRQYPVRDYVAPVYHHYKNTLASLHVIQPVSVI